MQIGHVAEQLGQVVRPGRGGRLSLLADAQIGEPEPLARGEGPLSGILQCQVIDRRTRQCRNSAPGSSVLGKGRCDTGDPGGEGRTEDEAIAKPA